MNSESIVSQIGDSNSNSNGNELLKGGDKWDGTIRGVDGCMYGVPFKARKVLKLNSTDRSISIIGPDLGNGESKWSGGALCLADGCIYCAPFNAEYVLRINTNPKNSPQSRIKSGVTVLTNVELPEEGDGKWCSGGFSPLDGCVYFMPCNARKILKLDPSWYPEAESDSESDVSLDTDSESNEDSSVDSNVESNSDSDTPDRYDLPESDTDRDCDRDRDAEPGPVPLPETRVHSVGEDLDKEGYQMCKFLGTVIGVNGYVYGIPHFYDYFVKFNPLSQRTLFITGNVHETALDRFNCNNGTLVEHDNCIFALSNDGFIFNLDCEDDTLYVHTVDVYPLPVAIANGGPSWGDGVLAHDGNIYWPPCNAARVLQFSLHTERSTLVGPDLGTVEGKYTSGALTLESDGSCIYCLPAFSDQILIIDPAQEFRSRLKNDMEEHPEKLGFLFEANVTNTNTNTNTDGDNNVARQGNKKTLTRYQRAILNHGVHRTMQVIEECAFEYLRFNEPCSKNNLYPFMVAASYQNSPLSVIYLLLRRHPSVMMLVALAQGAGDNATVDFDDNRRPADYERTKDEDDEGISLDQNKRQRM